MEYIIIIIILYILLVPKSKRRRPRRHTRRTARRRSPRVKFTPQYKPASFSIGVPQNDYRKFIAKNLPEKLSTYKYFYPSYFTRLAAQVLSDGKISRFTEDELLPDIDKDKAFAAFQESVEIISARQHSVESIKNAIESGAKFITLKVSRGCDSCPLLPSEKKYKRGEDVPIFPCLDCKENPRCDIWYKIDF